MQPSDDDTQYTWSAAVGCSMIKNLPKISPHPKHQPELLQQDRMVSCFHVVYSKFDAIMQISQQKLQRIKT